MTRSAPEPAKIVFRDPIGDWHENPDPSWIKQVIVDLDRQFWESGGGVAAIDFYENEERRAVLYLKARAKYGFIVDYDREGSEEGYFVLRNDEHTGETVESVVGGDGVSYWREHFVPADMAWEAVDYFLRTGDRKRTLVWEIHNAPVI
ncbi:MAG TPA: hypothetical protein VFV34_05280 [Blastocatellia bacterium]|nr:hypothetical protein [Blastocatellia bacterium]